MDWYPLLKSLRIAAIATLAFSDKGTLRAF